MRAIALSRRTNIAFAALRAMYKTRGVFTFYMNYYQIDVAIIH